jgi:hypothetical protein
MCSDLGTKIGLVPIGPTTSRHGASPDDKRDAPPIENCGQLIARLRRYVAGLVRIALAPAAGSVQRTALTT